MAAGLSHLAQTEQHLGQPARTVQLYWAARNIYDSTGVWHQEDDLKLEEYLASCRVALGESAFAAATEEGRTMTMDQSIEYALELSASSSV